MKQPYQPHRLLENRLWIGWICLIFITSCFVVPFRTFIYGVQHLSSSPVDQHRFARFWLKDGFFFVKGWHMTEYAILVSLIVIALRRRNKAGRLMDIWRTFAFAVFFAASDEWHQTFVPGREGNVRDVCIDTGGALLATLFWSVRLWHVKRKHGGTPILSNEA